MALRFEVAKSNYVTIGDAASLTWPAARCVVFWMRKPTNAGTDAEVIVDIKNGNRLSLYVYESSNANTARRDRARCTFFDGTTTMYLTSADPDPVVAGDSVWRVIVMQSIASNSWELWECPQNGAAVLLASSTSSLSLPYDFINPWYIGGRANATKFANVDLAEFSISDTYLTSTEIAAIASGLDITSPSVRATPIAPVCYLNMRSLTLTDLSGNSNNGTFFGDSSTALITHPYITAGRNTLRPMQPLRGL